MLNFLLNSSSDLTTLQILKFHALRYTSYLSWSMLSHFLSEEQSYDGSDGVSNDGHLTIVQCHPYHQPPSLDLYLDLHWNSSSTLIPPTNHHSYHFHCQPAPCAIYHSTTGAPPRSTHVPCCRPIISHMHQFSRSWVSVTTRTCENLC